ncbi:MAG: hypothetical protein PHD10_04625 [Bacilli bacterium]|nr:hypothetical protein [Bacilli bacterium]MDD4608394.1 hypothetical protein [Bacilli bacterium]
MNDLIFSISVFIVIYLLYLFIVVLRQDKLEKFTSAKEITLLVNRHKLNLDKINVKSLANAVALSNSFIISFAIYVASLVDNLILQILIGFLVIIPSILIIYYIIGKHFKKKEVKHNV